MIVAAIGIVIAAKFAVAATLPLFYGDEPYYWLWSRHLAWGYYDHPPAIAALVRVGTELFGNTALGVRFAGVLLSIPATLCVWRAGTLLLGGAGNGALAALFFNLMLQTNVQSLLAGPDAALLPCAAAFVWALAELIASGNGRWWLAAGLFAGLGLQSKYTMLGLGAGAFIWLLVTKEGRAWLRTPWPWLGGIIALLVVAPNVLWNLENSWGTFVFQFGRVASGDVRWHYLPQFAIEQLVLASPLIMILAMCALWRATWSSDQKRILIAALLWPTILFLVIHGLHARIHRAWTNVLFPVLAVAAVDAFRQRLGPRWLRSAAVPVAAVMLAVPYGLVLLRALPYERLDPAVREGISGNAAVPIVQALSLTKAHSIVTTDYQTTAWLRFHLPSPVPVIQIEDTYRFSYARLPAASDLAGTLIYVGRSDLVVPRLKRLFSDVETVRGTAGAPHTPLHVYRLRGFKGEPLGRMP